MYTLKIVKCRYLISPINFNTFFQKGVGIDSSSSKEGPSMVARLMSLVNSIPKESEPLIQPILADLDGPDEEQSEPQSVWVPEEMRNALDIPMLVDPYILGLSANVSIGCRQINVESLIDNRHDWNALSQYEKDCVYAKTAFQGSQPNQIICALCKSMFVNAQNYKRHIRNHFGEVNIKCGICSKGFRFTRDLIGHMTKHTNVKNFRCHICGNKYAYKRALTHHINLHHQKVSTSQASSQSSPQSGRLPIEALMQTISSIGGSTDTSLSRGYSAAGNKSDSTDTNDSLTYITQFPIKLEGTKIETEDMQSSQNE